MSGMMKNVRPALALLALIPAVLATTEAAAGRAPPDASAPTPKQDDGLFL
jgi:hypothetical protein